MNTAMVQRSLDKAMDKPLNVQDIPENTWKSPRGRFEELLVDVATNRNRESFVELFEHFAPRVKSFLMKGGTAEDVADELAQETMLTVWNKAASFNPAQASASTWIFTIARNKKIDVLRRTGRYEVQPSEGVLENAESDAPSQTAAAMAAQETEAIAAALKTLPEEQAMLLHKSFFEDKSHADIAKETGLALGTVKSRIRLALERLRKLNTVKELR